MLHAVFFVGDHSVEIDIFNASENIALHMRINLLKFCDQLLDLHSLGNTGSICAACSTGICKPACTLKKMKVIIISPLLDIILSDKIHGTDQLHTLKIGAV